VSDNPITWLIVDGVPRRSGNLLAATAHLVERRGGDDRLEFHQYLGVMRSK